MRAPTVRNLCTLSNLLLSEVLTCKRNTIVVPSTKPSPESELDLARDTSQEEFCCVNGFWFLVLNELEQCWGLCWQMRWLRCFVSLVATLVSCWGIWASKEDKRSASEEIDDDDEKRQRAVDIPWIPGLSHGKLWVKRKEVARERKQKWIFKCTSDDRFDRLIKMCADKLGAGKTVYVFGHLGRETGVKEYNALIKMCIKKARATDDEFIGVREMSKAFHLFKSMRDLGYPLEEKTYAENPSSASQLGYYEMLLWLRVGDEEMIQDICEYITVETSEDTSALRESYLMALWESDRKMQILDVVKNIDITELSSEKSIADIFQSLGRFQLESVADDLLLDLRAREDIILKVKNLHELLEVLPSTSSYEKLILHCCGLEKVGVALDIVEKMCEAGFTLSTEVLQYILQICEESYEYVLVYYIFLSPYYSSPLNGEICRCLVHFFVRMKDFEGAFRMIADLEDMNFKPTTNVYNAIMAGYFREKNISGVLRVLKKMRGANVKPDSQTFSYLIRNCEKEEDIMKVA
uniref:Pentacotripeptide-repeat region of PRORP domain-containing protein n=1 Tax=Glycine max TaxID=3847 RepID=A0A367GL20_SOYBN